jgi:glycopeptide antibiotics resistance protein
MAPDKWRHFYAGIVMGVVLQGLCYLLMPNKIALTVVPVLVLVIAISYGFELFSLITGLGVYDFMDAVASAIGGAFGIGLALLLGSWLI